jgi:hypothetical protein
MSVNDAVVSGASASSSAGAVNLSLIKISTITQTLLGVAVTGLVVLATVVTIVLISTRAGYDPPLAFPDSATSFKNNVFDIYPLANDKNPRGDNLTITAITTPDFGSAQIVDGNKVQFTAGKYWAGTVYMNYTCMNDKLTAASTITVFITNRAPEPINQAYTISKNSVNNRLDIFSYTNTLGQKVSDIDGDLMYLANATQPTHGSLTFDNNYVYYTPQNNYIDVDSFQYCVSDFNDTACSYVNVTVMNDAPVAVSDQYTIPKNTPSPFSVMENDYDPNNDTILITEVGNAAYGAVSVFNENTQVYYTPVIPSSVYSDSFSYGITDGILSGFAYVIVDIVNAVPTAGAVSVTIHKNTNATAINLPMADADKLDTLTVTIPKPTSVGTYKLVNSPSFGQVAIDGDKYTYAGNNYTMLYTPLPGLSGVYQEVITYAVFDGTDTTTGTVTISVVNDAPTAVADVVTVQKNIATTANLVANDFDINGDDIKIVASSSPIATAQGGSYVVNADGKTITFTPKQGFLGNDSATYTLTDIQAKAADQFTATGTITFVVVNTPPVPQDDSYTISKGHFKLLDVLTNDTDPNGDAVSIQSAGSPNSNAPVAIVTVNGIQYINYTALNRVYSDAWPYTAVDVDGAAVQAKVNVAVYNEAPVANPDTASVAWNRAITIDVQANDYDNNPGDSALFVTSLLSANTTGGGSVVVVAGKAVQYTPASGFVGTDSFQYRISDQIDNSNYASVSVSVFNDAPIANPTTVSLHWGKSIAINVLGIDNNRDPNGDTISVTAVSNPANGAVVLANGIATYTPTNTASNKFVGQDSFTYTLSDGQLSATATVSISVTNAAPVANPVSITTHWNSSMVTGYVASVCTDADSDPLTIKAITVPSGFKGAMNIASGNTNVEYTPTAWKGVQSVGYTITDGPATASSNIQVTVTNADVPTAADKTFTEHWTTQKVTGTTFTILNSVGQKDTDGDVLTLTSSSSATKSGSVTNNGASITYKHSNFLDTESFTYTVSDGLDSATGTVTFTIFNNAPTAQDFTISHPWSQLVSGKAFDAKVACNAADPDAAMGDVPSVSAASTTGTTIGTIARAGNVITFTPTKSMTGVQDISVTFTDGLSTVNAVMHIGVSNSLPVAAPVAKSVHWRTQATGTTWNLVALNEITDIDGDSVSIVAASATNGAVSLSGNNLKFTQTTNFLGAATFTATFTDGWENNTATWNVNVYNNKPVATAQSFSVLWSTWNSGTLMNVAASATDADSDPVTLLSVGTPNNGGSATIVSGQVLYKPSKGFTGTETFAFNVTDGLEIATQTVTVSVTDVPPTGVADIATMQWSAFTTTVNVLSNDWDFENDTIAINAITAQPAIGTFSVVDAAAGTVKLTMPSTLPVTFGLGPVTGSYTPKDGALPGAAASVTVNIVNANQPTANAIPATFHWRTTQAGASINIPTLTTATDADGDVLTLSLVGTPAYASLPGDIGKITYTRPSFVGSDSFNYKISDGMSSATAAINFNSINSAPNASDIAPQFAGKSAFTSGMTINVVSLGKASDADAADVPFLSLVAVTKLNTYTSATVQVKDATSVFFKPVVGDFNSDYFDFTITDGIANVTRRCYVYTTVAAPGDGSYYNSIHWSTYAAGSSFNTILTDAFDASGANYKINSFRSTPSSGAVATIVGSSTNNYITYKQSANFTGDDSFSLNVTSDVGTSVKLDVVINVFDSPPVPATKSVSTHWKTAVTTNVVSGTTDPDVQDTTFTLKSFGTPSTGSTAASGAQSVIFTPSATIGSTSYSFVVSDGLLSSTGSVSVSVTNSPPTAGALAYSIHWGVFKAGTALNVMVNSTDSNGDALSLVGTTTSNLPTSVTVVANTGLGQVTVKGPASPVYYGQSFPFTYTVTDGASNGQVSATATVSVFNNAPVTTPKTNSIHWRDVSVSKDVKTGCTDADSDTITLTGATSSQGATVSVSGNNVIYTPKANFIGDDAVTYTVTDGAQSVTGTYTVTVNNAKPVAKPYTISNSWKNLQNGYIFNIGGDANDTDVNDRPFLGLSGTLPTVTGATLTKINNTHIKLTPNAGFVGTLSFQYSVTDGLAVSDPVSVSVTVNNNAPYATPSATNIHWRTTSTTIDLTSKLIDADNDAITITSVTSDSGAATVSKSGLVVTYTQNAIGTVGADTFTVTFTDGWTQPASTAQFTVNTIDFVPVPQPISVNLHSSKFATGAIVNIINNANTTLRPTETDSADLPFLRVTAVSGTYVGTASISTTTTTSDTVTYKPPQGTIAVSTVTYTVSDGAKSGTGQLSVNVYNNAPSNTDYPTSIKWSDCVNGVSINIKQNAYDADPEDATLTYSTPTSTRATITQATNGILTYKCNAASVFTETLSFTTTDSGGLSVTNAIQITITNAQPVGNPDSYLVHWKSASFAANVLANDTDANNDVLSIVGLTPTTTQAGATLSIVSGKIQYTMPQSAITAAKLGVADNFNYQASDSVSTSASTRVSVTIYDNAPVAQAQSATIKWNAAASFSLLSKCTDADGDSMTFEGITQPVSGTVVVTSNATGAVTFTPSAATTSTTTYNTPYTMTYSCKDGLLTGSGQVTVNVFNTAPTVAAKSASINRNYNNPTFTGLTGLRPSTTDADGDTVTVTAVTADADTQLSTSATSDTFSVTVPRTFAGTKTFTWKLTDGQLQSPAATYTLNFVNRLPVCPPVSGLNTYKGVPVSTTLACTDADNDSITYAYSSAGVTKGTLSGTAPSVTFTPTALRSGQTVIGFTGTDITGGQTSSTVTVNVLNRAPTASDIAYPVEGSHANNQLYTFDYLTDAAPSDADSGDSVSILSAGLPSDSCNANGVGVVGLSNGKVTWTRSLSSWTGNCTITVTVTDNDQDFPATATAKITVAVALNSPYPPTAVDDSYSTPQATTTFQIPITGTLTSSGVTISGVMENDKAPLGTSIVFDTLICNTAAGFCKQTPQVQNGYINYPVNTRNCVADKFQYQIKTTDSLAMTAIATVTISFTNCYCQSALDIFFVIDSSGSIGADNFETQRAFLVNLTKSLDIANDKVKVGVSHNFLNVLIPLDSAVWLGWQCVPLNFWQ